MTWSLLGEWNCQISSEFKNLRQSSTRIPSVKLPRTHLLASGHTYSMTGVMTICSRARIKFLKKIGHLSPEFRFTVNPHDGPNRLSDWGVTNGGCNSKSTQTLNEKLKSHSSWLDFRDSIHEPCPPYTHQSTPSPTYQKYF